MLTFHETAFEKHLLRPYVCTCTRPYRLYQKNRPHVVVKRNRFRSILRAPLSLLCGYWRATRHPEKVKPSCFVFTRGEWHETDRFFSDYIIRSRGYKTVYSRPECAVYNCTGSISNTNNTSAGLVRGSPGPRAMRRKYTTWPSWQQKCHILLAAAACSFKTWRWLKCDAVFFACWPVNLLK